MTLALQLLALAAAALALVVAAVVARRRAVTGVDLRRNTTAMRALRDAVARVEAKVRDEDAAREDEARAATLQVGPAEDAAPLYVGTVTPTGESWTIARVEPEPSWRVMLTHVEPTSDATCPGSSENAPRLWDHSADEARRGSEVRSCVN